MPKRLEIKSGEKFGRFTIIKEMPSKARNRYVLCRCDCGNIRNVCLSILRAGKSKSCGCFRNERAQALKLKHGLCFTHIYSCWEGIKRRCLNSKCSSYSDYGGRGIKVCEDWMDFRAFHQWAIANGYKEGLTIERKDFNGNYEPSNCTWIPLSEQANNTRRNIKITYNDKTQTLMQWSNELGIKYNTLRRRLELGWPTEKILITPTCSKYSKTKRCNIAV